MSEQREFTPPAHFRRQIDEAVARYRAWRGGDEAVVFTYVTDVHSYRGCLSDPPDYMDTKMHIPLELFTADLIDADFAADTGDMDFDTPCFNVENITARYNSQMAIYGAYRSRPLVFACGNHDYGYVLKGLTEKVLDSRRFGDAFCRLSSRAGFQGYTFGQDNASWGHYDIPAKKTRVFFLNSSDGDYYGHSREQLDFLARRAAAVPDGWTIITLHHYASLWSHAKRRAKGLAPSATTRFPRTDTLAEIEVAMANGLKGSLGDVSWDFSSFKARDVRFAGAFCGDAHNDITAECEGAHCCVSQGYGKFAWEAPQSLREMKTVAYEFFNLDEKCLFEIVACKTARREVHVFRVGAGGIKRDREWRY